MLIIFLSNFVTIVCGLFDKLFASKTFYIHLSIFIILILFD